MKPVNGLAQVLGRADAVARRGSVAVAERAAVVTSLLDRQVSAGRKAGLFELSPRDWEEGPRLWTGELIRTKLAAEHVFSQEAGRLLHRLAGADPTVRQSVSRTAARLAGTCYAVQHCTIGECATSFIGYVRFLTSVCGDEARGDVAWRLQTLLQHRSPNGRWKHFPFYYTVLVLSELPPPAGEGELAHASEACARALRRPSIGEPYATRRTRLLRHVLKEATPEPS
ncbi:MAG: hypothetical protein AB7V19_06500 [Candidatus Bipolaricaulia bacterium]